MLLQPVIDLASQQREASDKLKHYADTYGQWIHILSPGGARCISHGRRTLADQEPDSLKKLPLLVESVQFESIAKCLAILRGY